MSRYRQKLTRTKFRNTCLVLLIVSLNIGCIAEKDLPTALSTTELKYETIEMSTDSPEIWSSMILDRSFGVDADTEYPVYYPADHTTEHTFIYTAFNSYFPYFGACDFNDVIVRSSYMIDANTTVTTPVYNHDNSPLTPDMSITYNDGWRGSINTELMHDGATADLSIGVIFYEVTMGDTIKYRTLNPSDIKMEYGGDGSNCQAVGSEYYLGVQFADMFPQSNYSDKETADYPNGSPGQTIHFEISNQGAPLTGTEGKDLWITTFIYNNDTKYEILPAGHSEYTDINTLFNFTNLVDITYIKSLNVTIGLEDFDINNIPYGLEFISCAAFKGAPENVHITRQYPELTSWLDSNGEHYVTWWQNGLY